MTRSEEKIIVEMYRSEAPYSAIAAAINKSETSIKHWVAKNRAKHRLERRRSQAETTGVNTPAAELASSWNLVESVKMLKKKWSKS